MKVYKIDNESKFGVTLDLISHSISVWHITEILGYLRTSEKE